MPGRLLSVTCSTSFLVSKTRRRDGRGGGRPFAVYHAVRLVRLRALSVSDLKRLDACLRVPRVSLRCVCGA